jgi:V-type H+-transporting ATPase subunit B
MAKGDDVDPRMMSVTPRIRYNTIGGVNGPLVILDNVGRGHDTWLST